MFFLLVLAITDFFTGLLNQPFFVMYKLAAITGKRMMHYIVGIVAESVPLYFSFNIQ